jgi:DNA anti-recombination protein RmuC
MSSKGITFFGRAAVLVGIGALVLAQQPVWAQKTAEKAGEDRKQFRTSVLAIKGQIDTTLKALNGIGEAKDAKARSSAFKKYSDEVKSMEKQIDKTRDYAQSMRERGQAYFKEWEKSTKGVTNEALKASATERQAALKAQYQKIEESIAKAKDDSAKFWKNLQDVQKYYASDLSDNAITTSAELVKTTNTDGKTIQGYIDEVVTAVDQVGAQVEKTQTASTTGEAEPPKEGEAPKPPRF